jgi:hypothetical protein
MIGRLLKNDYKDIPKKSPKKNFQKSLKNVIKRKKTSFPKKASKKSSKKVLKRKKNKQYIVTHRHASLNFFGQFFAPAPPQHRCQKIEKNNPVYRREEFINFLCDIRGVLVVCVFVQTSNFV